MNGRTRFAGRRIDAATASALAVGVGAVLVRFPRVLTDPFWQDEVASARILRAPTVGAMLARVARSESTPPLWYTLGWLLHRLGVSLTDVRLLSVACGGLLATLVVRFAAGLLPTAAAVAAGVLVSLGGELSFADRELRAYALLALLALLSLVFALLLDRQAVGAGPGSLAALGLVTAAGALTHYFFLFTVASGLGWLWFEPEAREARRRATIAIAGGLALAAPWLPFALSQYRHDRYSWIGGFNGRVAANTPFRLFTPLVQTEWLPAVFLALVVFGALRLARRTARGRLCAALALGPLALAALTWAAGIRVYADRNMLEIAAFVAICAAAGLVAPLPRLTLILSGALAAAAIASFVLAQSPSTPFPQIAHTLVAEGWHTGDPIAVFGSPYAYRSPLEWYLPRGPRLGFAKAPVRCGPGFVVAGRRAARTLADDLQHGRAAGRFIIARLHADEPVHGEWWLDTPHGASCGTKRSSAA